MGSYSLSIRPFGQHAILIEWPNRVDEAILDDILHFSNFLKKECLEKDFWEMVPAYNSLTLIYREQPIVFKKFKLQLEKWYLNDWNVSTEQRYLWRLPVCYDEEFAIDLSEVATKLSMTPQEIIKLHTSSIYTLFGIGFLPGFMYLGGLAKALEVPRRAQPRPKVIKGSVGLAAQQTGIYPQDSPGGWNIIGNCSVQMFDPKKENPCFINVGDKVQFYAIERAEYNLHKIEAEVGIFKLNKSLWNAEST